MPSACPVCSTPLPTPTDVCDRCGWNPAGGETAAHLTGGETAGSAPREDPDERPVPPALLRRLPDYTSWAYIGHGGMGDVWTAWHPVLDREVAVKALRPAVADNPRFAERFEREAKALAKLDRPDVVRVYDFGRADDVYFLVMEFVPDNLREYRPNLPGGAGPAALRDTSALNRLLDFFLRVCRAAAAAHDAGYVHRDIKPENILVTEDGQPKLADFGLARLYDAETNLRRLIDRIEGKEPDPDDESAALVVGTPNYMAPEQRSDPALVDQRADVYALGVVFYELLFGERPAGKFPMPSEAGLDPRLDAIVSRTLAPKPRDRYRSAAELVTALEEIRKYRPSVLLAHSVLALVVTATTVVWIPLIHKNPLANWASHAWLIFGSCIPMWIGTFFSDPAIPWYRRWMRLAQRGLLFLIAGAVNVFGPLFGPPDEALVNGLTTGEWFALVATWLWAQWQALVLTAVALVDRSVTPHRLKLPLPILGLLLAVPLGAFLWCVSEAFFPHGNAAQWGPALMTAVVFAFWLALEWAEPE